MLAMSLEIALQYGLDELKLALTDSQISHLLAYQAQLQKWGAVFNLTAVTESTAALQLHLLDCLTLVAALRRRYAGQHLELLDVGSGAGLPAVILAICSDAKQGSYTVTSVDSVEKKIAFQRQQKGLFNLTNLQPLHQRIESMANQKAFDLITCRAFASLADFCQQTQHLVKTVPQAQPTRVAMKAKLEAPERLDLARLAPAVQLLETEPVQVPGLVAQRQLVWLH
jgi:16S rRNA (guanine527-N7)-methyltransferase